jgi:hypothetical protein
MLSLHAHYIHAHTSGSPHFPPQRLPPKIGGLKSEFIWNSAVGISKFNFVFPRTSCANRSQSCQGSLAASGPTLHIMLHQSTWLLATIFLRFHWAGILFAFIHTRQSSILSTISSMRHPYKFGFLQWQASPRPQPAAPAPSYCSHIDAFLSIIDRQHDLAFRRCLRLGHRQHHLQLSSTHSCILQRCVDVSEEGHRPYPRGRTYDLPGRSSQRVPSFSSSAATSTPGRQRLWPSS